ncbi:MAG: DUF4301 family protein [Deltaproteobacteria bacterium]|nr:DUF4301 family protein [Deltaproteobacteria bacterium]
MTGAQVFSPADIEQIEKHGLTVAQVEAQLEIFRRGIEPIDLDRPCTVGDGILRLGEDEIDRLGDLYAARGADPGRAMKFVPASGAASRMFQLLVSCYAKHGRGGRPVSMEEVLNDPEYAEIPKMFTQLDRFAFYDQLRAGLAREGKKLEEMLEDGRCYQVVEYLLAEKGLNLAGMPKGLIAFHRYPDHVRTPFIEHLVEALFYLRDRNGRCRLHFTVAAAHRRLFEQHREQVLRSLSRDGAEFMVDFSVQDPATDTIAVDHDNQPCRNPDGSLVFRPGGHGALLVNLNNLQGDLVFIKNIDNVVPDRLKPLICRYEKALGGCLVELQEKIFSYLRRLDESAAAAADPAPLLAEIAAFAAASLDLKPPAAAASPSQQAAYWRSRLDRPLRVCAMVKNEGHPGGGPFWVRPGRHLGGKQIVESAQVAMENEEQRQIWEQATHFNPVDLVCGLRDYRGRPFDLAKFTDPRAGLITRKSKDGQELKALEHPGLWNGAMADWNTVFVEVPAATFNPVKTVFDLLRPEHQ